MNNIYHSKNYILFEDRLYELNKMMYQELKKIINKSWKKEKKENTMYLKYPENTYFVLYFKKYKDGDEIVYKVLLKETHILGETNFITDYREAVEALKSYNFGDNYYLVQLKGIMNANITNAFDKKAA